jgi:N-acetylglucosamine-6-phosphate deacetylase
MVLRGKVVLPDRVLDAGEVAIEGGRIARVRATSAAGDGYLVPGYVDLHVHGGGGADYMDGTPDAVRTVNRTHARHGTTTIFPTTTTGSPERVRRMIEACRETAAHWTPEDGARIGGVHLYGPYFAESKAGCHDRDGCRAPDPREYEALLSLGIVRIATCAAELPGAEAFYRAARKRRCLVTCGHSDASWTEMARAYRAGMRHVDHFWCAMSSVPSIRTRLGTPMQGSMEQFVLAHPDMSTEVIADGKHLSDELLAFAYRFKGAQRLCLVTDANRAVDQPGGRYRFGAIEDGPWFESDGSVGFVRGQGLASSVVGMDTLVRVMRRATKAPLHDVIRMATLTPAERAGIARTCGSIEAGKRADLLLLDRSLRVRKVWVGGEEMPVEA